MALPTASDNPFPSILAVETASASISSPAAGKQRLFVDTDHVLKYKNSGGTVSNVGSGSGDVATDAIWDAKGDLAGGTGANTAARLAVGTNDYVLTADSAQTTGLKWAAAGGLSADLLPWLIDIDVYPTAATNTNWDTINISSGELYAGEKRSSGAQNDLIGWDVVLAAGTWALEITMSSDVGRGIFTVKLDATTAGTIDGYNATTLNPTRRSLTGITVGTTAKYRLTLTMATKNVSASTYFGIIYAVRLMRTA